MGDVQTLLLNAVAGWLTPKRVRHYPVILMLVTLAIFTGTVVAGDPPFDALGRPFAVDFSAQITAGRIALDGEIAQIYQVNHQRDVQQEIFDHRDPTYLNLFLSPPAVAFLYAPFAALPYIPAALLWMAVSVAILVLDLRLLWPLVPGLHRYGFKWVGLLAFCFPPVLECIQTGQDSLLLLLLLVSAVRLMLARRDLAAGAVLGLGLVKPQMFLLFLVLLLAQRRWRALGSFVAMGAILGLCSLALVGPRGISQYVDLLSSDIYTNGIAEPLNWKMQSLAALFHAVTPTALWLPVDVVTLAAGAVAAWFIGRHQGALPPGRVADLFRYAAVVLLAALANPHFFLYDSTVLLLPGLVLLAARPASPGTRVAVAAFFLLAATAPVRHLAAASLPSPFHAIEAQWTVIPMGALLLIAWRCLDAWQNTVSTG